MIKFSLKKITPKLRVIIIVTLSMAAFAAFGLFNIQTTLKNQDRLKSIQSVYFPVLENIDATIVSMDQLKDRILRAVVTADSDLLEEADSLLDKTRNSLDRLSGIDSRNAGKFSRIQSDLLAYHQLSSETATLYMDMNIELDEVESRVAKMNSIYDKMLKGIKVIRDDHYAEFIGTLGSANNSAEKMVYLGFLVGALNMMFIWSLAISINKNINMMAIIREQNENLERTVDLRTAQLQQKTNDMKVMLANMRQGVFTIKEDLTIHSEYSDYLVDIVGTSDIAGKDVIELILSQSDLTAEQLDQIKSVLIASIGESEMAYDFNRHLLVSEICIDHSTDSETQCDARKIVELDWVPILNSEEVTDKVLVIGRDVTEIRALSDEAEQRKRELDIIGQMLEIPQEVFNEFLEFSYQSLAQIRGLLSAEKNWGMATLDNIYGQLHTMKGNARTYSLNYLSSTIHNVESIYDQLKASGDLSVDLNSLREDIDSIDEVLNIYSSIFKDKLSTYGSDERDANRVLSSISELIGEFDAGTPAEAEPILRKIVYAVKRWQHRSLSEVIAPLSKGLVDIANQLGKAEPHVRVVGGGVFLASGIVQPIKDVLTHCFRNAIDHGIESPEEREKLGKDVRGLISIDASFANDKLLLEVMDDGQGLNISYLESKIMQREISSSGSLSDELIANVIFKSSVSSKTEVSDISGRGVGMSEAKKIIESLGGSIDIVFIDNSRQQSGYRRFKFVVTLPSKYFG